tara:strand:+ start:1946 stop:2359 length:414 start_codon:yes stop_codon:yes gene_type:complete
MEVHPTAKLIKQLHFTSYRNITFKKTDKENRNHMCYQPYDKYVDNYDKTNLPYFIGYRFYIYKNEFNMQTEKPDNIFIIQFKASKMHKFPNSQKIKLKSFEKSDGINIFQPNFLHTEPKYSKQNIFHMYCGGDFYKI